MKCIQCKQDYESEDKTSIFCNDKCKHEARLAWAEQIRVSCGAGAAAIANTPACAKAERKP